MIRLIRTAAAFLAALALAPAPAAANGDAAGAPITIPWIGRPPRIEDFEGAAGPTGQLRIDDFRQRQPAEGAPVSRQTTAYLSYDRSNLYAVFVCKEEPGKVRAHLSRRESVSSDDLVGINLDTFHDGRRAYMFYSNPLGVQLDGITTEGQSDDYTFDAVWRTEGKLLPDGYIVLIAIPFKSVRFAAGPGKTWGIALMRVIRRNQEYSMWPRITDRVEAYVPQFAPAGGLDAASPGRNVQIVPYGFLEREHFLDGGRLRRAEEVRGGVDAKVVLRESLTLDLTVNPDFSQVESDEPQVTVNRRYEVFFPERRPFFVENSGYFQTPETLFFSRRVVNPQFGARLTGKIGGWSIGLLAMDDRTPGVSFGTSDDLAGGANRARIGVARVQRDIRDGSAVGFLMTSDHDGQGRNDVFSADLRLKLNPNWIFTGQATRSLSSGGGAAQSGAAMFAEIRHKGKHVNYYTRYRDRSPGFRADLGFIPRVDIRQITNSAEYQWWPEGGALVSFGPGIYTGADWDHSGRLQDWSVETPFTLNFKGPAAIEVSRQESYEFYQGRGFRKNGTSIDASTERWKWMGLSGSYRQGADLNYYPGTGLAPFTAKSQDAAAGLRFRPGARLRFEESYVFSRLAGSATVFDNHLIRSKVNYQLTRSLSIRGIVDYNAVLPNERLVNLEREKRFNVDVLATYMPHPGTALYVGYGDRYENLLPPFFRQRVAVPGYSTGRQIFVKFSYLLRL